jgi:Zn-dependent peptidase ImmA (M78 family)
LDPEFVWEVLPTHEMGDEHGLTIPSEHIIRLREDVYNRACDGHGRDRMTVAHEIGHYLLHRTPAVFARGDNKKKKEEPLPPFRSSEWQANCFGAELLVFPEGIDASMADTEVAKMRGVSKDAAAYQMRTYRKEGLVR